MTKTLKKYIPEEMKNRWDWGNYTELLETFGYEIIINIKEDNWQGDSWIIFKLDAEYGYLTFGWGSCSGCDALYACKNAKDYENLRQELFNQIQWHETLTDLKEWFKEHDFKGDFSFWSDSECVNRLIQEVADLKEYADANPDNIHHPQPRKDSHYA